MNFTAKRINLLKAVELASIGISMRTTMPALNHLLVSSESPDRIELMGTDVNRRIEVNCEASVEKAEGIGVPAALLEHFVKASRGDEVSFTRKGSKVQVKSGKSKAELPWIAANEFPGVTPIEASSAVIPAFGLHRRLTQIRSAQAKNDEARRFLEGVLFDFDGSVLKLTATDGRMMIMAEMDFNGPKIRCPVPAPLIAMLIHALQGQSGDVEIFFSDKSAMFKTADWTVSGALMNTSYPDLSFLLQPKDRKPATVSLGELKSAIRSASCFNGSKLGSVKFEFLEKTLRVKSTGQDQAFDQEIEAEAFEIEFNLWPNYILDLLSGFGGERVTFQIADRLTPIIIAESGLTAYICPMIT